MANASIFAAFERFWLHVTAALGNKADIAHTHDAYVNQNAFSKITVGSTTIEADTATDTLTLVAGSNVTLTPNAANDKITIDTIGLATVATSGSYNDLTNKPTIPTVNNGTLTIQKNGTAVATFTANQSTNATANITVPTKTSELTNDSGFKTTDNNTTYTFGTGDNNGTIKVTPSGGSAQNIAVKGLGTAAYTASTAYAVAGHAHTMLSNKYTSRPTTANIASSEDRKGTLEFFNATSAMTTGAPPFEGHILHMNWDNTGGWDAQLCVRNSTAGLAVRGSSNGTWGDWQEIAMKNHTHTNVGIVTLGGDVLALAASSCQTGLTPVITNSSSTNLPSGAYGYSAGYVIRRTTDQITIVLFDYNNGDIAVNTRNNSTWSGWVKGATQDYVRDAISNIGSSTASGQVCEFDSGAINLTSSSSPYTNSKDSKSKWYWIWAYNSTLGGYMGFHVDWKALTTGGQPIFCGSNTTTHFGITVSKNSSNKLVVSVPNDKTTVKRIVGYY